MGGKSCFRLSLHLNYFFQDHRSICRVFVSKEMNYIKDLKSHITNLFNIENFYLMCVNNFLPEEEDVRILQLDDTIVAVPISMPERDVTIPQNTRGSCKKDEVKKKRRKRKVSLDDIFGTESEVEKVLPKKKKKKKTEKKVKNAAFSPPAKSSPMLPVSNSPVDKDSAIAQCSGNSTKNDANDPSPDFVNKINYFEKLKDTPISGTSNMPKIVVTPPQETKSENDVVSNGSVDKNLIKQKLINVLQTDSFHFADISKKSSTKNETPETVEKSQATNPKKFSIRHNVTPFKPVTVLKSRTNIVKNIIKYNLSKQEENESENISQQSAKEENNSQMQEDMNSQTSQNLPEKFDSEISRNNNENSTNLPESPKKTTPKAPVPNHNDASPKIYDKNLTVPSIGPTELDYQIFQNAKKSDSVITSTDDSICPLKNLTVPCIDKTETGNSDSIQSDNTLNSEKYVTKRKRTRVRKRKKKSVEEVPFVPPPIVYKPPRTQAAPVSHIRFEDESNAKINGGESPGSNQVTECIEIDDEEMEDIKIESVSPSENNDVMIIDSEPENQQTIDNSFMKLINGKERISVFTSDVLSASITNDVIARCPRMDKILPRVNDVIVFKVLKITSSYTPAISSPITGKVTYYDSESGEVHFAILEGKHELAEPQGKFSVSADESEETPTNTKAFKWTELIEPRLLFP